MTRGFAERFDERRVDLFKRIEEGVPPLNFLPASDGMLIAGKRHLIAAPKKTGKSIGMLVHWVDVALADGRVLILDRENGANTYAERLGAIAEARHLDQRARAKVRRNLLYYEFPRLGEADGIALAEVAQENGASVVVFDSQRMYLSDLGLRESESDDYARFMGSLVDPLFEAEIATVILDNTGHSDPTRSRGTSAKGDLNEVLITMQPHVEFSQTRRGSLRLKLDPGRSRFGNEGEWEMTIGNGTFSEWLPVGANKTVPANFAEAVTKTLGDCPPGGISQNKLLRAVKELGVSAGKSEGPRHLLAMCEDGRVVVQPGSRNSKMYTLGGHLED